MQAKIENYNIRKWLKQEIIIQEKFWFLHIFITFLFNIIIIGVKSSGFVL